MVRLISVLTIQIIRLISIHFVKFRIFPLISIHFVKFRIFPLISIHFVKFWIVTATSIHFVNFRIFTQISIHFVKFRIFTLISIRFINFRINTSTSIHINWKSKILHLRILWPLYINKLDKFIFQKRGLKAHFSGSHWPAICRIHKNAVFWLTGKILLIHFVRINKLNVFAGDLPTEN